MLMRALAVFYIMLWFTMGLLLLFCPWISFWNANYFVHHYAWVKDVAHNNYLRGAVSGLGIANIGSGAYEAGLYLRRAR